MTHLLSLSEQPDNIILSTDLICMLSQQWPETTAEDQVLKAPSENQIVLCYQKNGHITLSSNISGKATSETASIYDTNQSLLSDTLHDIHNVWNALSTEGDCQSWLLVQQLFDDSMCYQLNTERISQERQALYSSDSLQGKNCWCENKVQISDDVMKGLYTIYWVWNWPTSLRTLRDLKRKTEIYTTCLDIEVVSP